MQHVLAAARSIGEHMTDYKLVIDKSTVPVGTADAGAPDTIAQRSWPSARPEAVPYSVVSNPEFLKEGAAVEDFMRPDRIVVGTCKTSAPSTADARALYAPFQRQRDKLVMMDIRSAELTKYAANAMLATRISFMNEMALLAEKLGADIEQVRRGIGSDPRIGHAVPVRRLRLRRLLLPQGREGPAARRYRCAGTLAPAACGGARQRAPEACAGGQAGRALR